jgi:branched-chain amino acid transport system permease protein
MWFFYAQREWNWILALVLSMIIVAFAGVILEKYFFRRFRGAILGSLIVAVALIFLIQASVATGWGFLDKAIPMPTAFKGTITWLGATLPKERLLVIAIAAACGIMLNLFLSRTRHGRSMRATAQDSDAAALQGISVNMASSLAMSIGCGLAALAGALAGSVFLINPYMGGSQLLNGLVVIVLGGMGSLPGTILGGFVIGFTQAFGSTYLSSSVAGMLVFLLLIVVLVVKPTGFLGRPVVHRL